MSGIEDKIIILDFGSQYTNLIARRIREMNVLSEIRSPTISLQDIMRECPKGIILSGGPGSVHDGQIPFDRLILESSLPILGICYGMQLLNSMNHGVVKSLGR